MQDLQLDFFLPENIFEKAVVMPRIVLQKLRNAAALKSKAKL